MSVWAGHAALKGRQKSTVVGHFDDKTALGCSLRTQQPHNARVAPRRVSVASGIDSFQLLAAACGNLPPHAHSMTTASSQRDPHFFRCQSHMFPMSARPVWRLYKGRVHNPTVVHLKKTDIGPHSWNSACRNTAFVLKVSPCVDHECAVGTCREQVQAAWAVFWTSFGE